MEPPAASKPKDHAEEYREKFLALFPELVAELTDEGLANPQVVDAMQHFKKVTHVLESLLWQTLNYTPNCLLHNAHLYILTDDGIQHSWR